MQTVATILSVAGWTSIPSLIVTATPYLVVAAAAVSVFDLSERVRERDALGRLPKTKIYYLLICAAVFIFGIIAHFTLTGFVIVGVIAVIGWIQILRGRGLFY